MRAFSVATHRQQAQLVVLEDSLRRQAPAWPLETLLIGPGTTERVGVAAEPLLARHGAELTRWWLTVELLIEEASAGRPALALPPGAWMIGSPEPLIQLMAEHGTVVAVRCDADPAGAVGEPTREQLRARGRLDPALLAVDGSPRSLQMLHSWRRRLSEALTDPHERGRRMSSQRRDWLNQGLELARLRGDLGVAGTDVVLSGWNAWDVDFDVKGIPAAILDMTGFDPTEPSQLGEHSSRLRLSEVPALAELVVGYRTELMHAGWLDPGRPDLIGAVLPDGTVFDRARWRQLCLACDLGQEFGDVATVAGNEALNAWLQQPAPGDLMPGISRYIAYRLLDERDDIAAAMGPLSSENERFIRWCREYGRTELPILERFLPHLSEPPPALRPNPSATDGPSRPPRVRFSGYLSHVLGLGAAARGYAEALGAAGVEVSTVSVAPDQPDRPEALARTYGRIDVQNVTVHPSAPHDFDVIAVNVDGLETFISRLGPGYFGDAPRVGLWAWEADPLPPSWRSAFRQVDEVWAMSEYTARVVGRGAPVPVLAMPPPVTVPTLTMAPTRLGVPDGFLFLFIFDFFSTLERKNPLGLIEAFKLAFPPGSGPRLLIKTLNGPRAPEAEEALLYAAAGHPEIHVVDASLTNDERNALVAGCDCYVSLHRSEGFGLTMAEAMALERPVIATGYSGNLDFMNTDNSLLVDFRRVHVGPRGGIYPADASWADPDLEHAARLMRQVRDDPDGARAMAARGRETILTTLSPSIRGAAMRRRLEELARDPGPTLDAP